MYQLHIWWIGWIIMKFIHNSGGKWQASKLSKKTGWRGSGLWSQSCQHIVKLMILARGLVQLPFLIVCANEWKRAVCAFSQKSTVCWRSGASLTETFFAGRDSFDPENLFTLLLACTKLTWCLERRAVSCSVFFAKQSRQKHGNRHAWRTNRAWGQSLSQSFGKGRDCGSGTQYF